MSKELELGQRCFIALFLCVRQAFMPTVSSLSLGEMHSHYLAHSPLPSIYDDILGTHAAWQ